MSLDTPHTVTITPHTYTFKQQSIYTQTYRNHTSQQTDNTAIVPFICLHGWMDNLASFEPLIDAMFEHATQPLTFIAIDLPGHGKSDHATGVNAYNIWSDISTIMSVLDSIGVTEFALLGHSRGAMIATLLAGTFPERVTHLCVIESIIAPVDASTLAPVGLRESVNSQIKLLTKKQNYYTTFDQAVQARAKGVVNVLYDDAKTLAQHGVRQSEKGFYWHVDAMLLAPSEIKLSLDQTQAFFEAITAPVHLVLGVDGLITPNKEMMAWIKKQPHLTPYILKGGHHLHMSQASYEVAQYLLNVTAKNR